MRKIEKKGLDKSKDSDRILLIFFLFIFTVFILYLFRRFDDNTLTNWQWTFSGARLLWILPLLAAGIGASAFLSKSDRFEMHPFIFLFPVSFIAVIPLWREPELILDVARYFIYAKYMELYGIGYFFSQWGTGINIWTDMPVVPFIYGLIFRLFGESRFYIQFFNTLLFSLTVLLTCSIGRTLWNKEIGFYAGLLLLGIPYLPTQAALMLVDVPSMFLFTLSVFTFIKAVNTGGPFWIVSSSVAVFLTIFAKYSMGLWLTILPVISLMAANGNFLRQVLLKRSAGVVIITGLLSGGLLLAKYDVFHDQFALLRSFQLPGLRGWHESFISTFFFQTHPFISLAAIYSIYAAVRKRDGKFVVAAWLLVLVLVLQIRRIRYIIPLFPLLTIMASYGISELRSSRRVKRFICLGIAASSLVVMLGAYSPFLSRISTVNIKNAGEYLNALECGTVGVYTLAETRSSGSTGVAIPILDMFTEKKLAYLRGSFGNDADESVKNASLRFTWEFELPKFYSSTKMAVKLPVAVVSSERMEALPAELTSLVNSNEIMSEFLISSGAFRYRTFVTVFGRDC